ncbi:MAG: SPOR domain-containing protein [Geminicoccaceae bacterium]|nr:SPOR domain-containing protein [Geminicoccaceae bacterium]
MPPPALPPTTATGAPAPSSPAASRPLAAGAPPPATAAPPPARPDQLVAREPPALRPSPAPAAAPGPTPAPPATAAPRPQAALPPAPPPAAGPAGRGPWGVQIAAVSSREAAERGWAALQSRHPEVLGGLQLRVEEARLANGLTLYRLQGIGLADREAAAQACTRLKAAGTECFVVGGR